MHCGLGTAPEGHAARLLSQHWARSGPASGTPGPGTPGSPTAEPAGDSPGALGQQLSMVSPWEVPGLRWCPRAACCEGRPAVEQRGGTSQGSDVPSCHIQVTLCEGKPKRGLLSCAVYPTHRFCVSFLIAAEIYLAALPSGWQLDLKKVSAEFGIPLRCVYPAHPALHLRWPCGA